MNVLIVSGFLGAGKTTFIKHLAATSGLSFAVLENEYGEVGVDGDDLRQQQLEVLELAEGCICCTRSGNFTSSLLALLGSLNPQWLVVEPSGVGLLGTIMNNLAPLAKTGIYALAPVTLVDGAAWALGLQDYGPYYEDQIRNAGTLVVTKTEDLPEAKRAELIEWLKTLNPQAELVDDDYRLRDPSWARSLFHKQATGESRPSVTLGLARPLQVTFTGLGIDVAGDCLELLEAMLDGQFGRIARAKGFAPFEEGQWGHFDLASGRWGLEPCAPMEPSRLIVIGQDLDVEGLQKAWKAQSYQEQVESHF